MKIKLPKFKNIKENNKGQALLLVVIVLFIVFFLVVSLSENISLDTVTVQNNADFNDALTSAESGISDAEKLALSNFSSGTVYTTAQSGTCSYTGTNGTYGCTYVIIPSYSINTVLQKDDTAQAYMAGATSVQLAYADSTSALLVNIIYGTGSSTQNYMCIMYPSTFTDNSNQAMYSKFTVDPRCPNPAIVGTTGGYYENTISNLPSNVQYVRATLLNYSGNGSSVIITPNINVTQQYEIIATGYYGSSRRIIDTHLDLYGDPPTIFDYALFNGGQNSQINF